MTAYLELFWLLTFQSFSYIPYKFWLSSLYEDFQRSPENTNYSPCQSQSGEASLEAAFWLLLHVQQGWNIARHFRDSVSVSVRCYLGVMVSIRSEYFAVDKIINKFHKLFLAIIYKIKIYFHCWYWWSVKMFKVLCTRSRYHLELYFFTKPLAHHTVDLSHPFLSLSLSSPKFLFSESG